MTTSGKTRSATPSTAATRARKPATVASKPAARPKAAARPVTKPTAPTAAKTAPVKEAKAKKPKMVRDSFTFPKTEYAVLGALKLRATKLGKPAKKTEVLRAGIKALAAMTDTALLAALQAVPSLKTGRPAGSKKKG